MSKREQDKYTLSKKRSKMFDPKQGFVGWWDESSDKSWLDKLADKIIKKGENKKTNK